MIYRMSAIDGISAERPMRLGHGWSRSATACNTPQQSAIKAISRCMVSSPPTGEVLAIRTAAVEPSLSAPLARPLACVAPPAQFGRLTQAVSDLSAEGSTAGCLGVLCWCPGSATDLAPCRSYWMTLLLPRGPYATIWSRCKWFRECPTDTMGASGCG